MNKPLQKIPRSQLRAVTLALLARQGHKCAICHEPISLVVMGNKSDYVCDHDHNTGEIRGILHRSCNAAEGKVANAAGHWGAKSMQYSAIIPYLENLVAYLKQQGTGMMYPDHKTKEQKDEAAKLKRRKVAAIKRAAEKVRENRK